MLEKGIVEDRPPTTKVKLVIGDKTVETQAHFVVCLFARDDADEEQIKVERMAEGMTNIDISCSVVKSMIKMGIEILNDMSGMVTPEEFAAILVDIEETLEAEMKGEYTDDENNN